MPAGRTTEDENGNKKKREEKKNTYVFSRNPPSPEGGIHRWREVLVGLGVGVGQLRHDRGHAGETDPSQRERHDRLAVPHELGGSQSPREVVRIEG